jgi:endonuclease G
MTNRHVAAIFTGGLGNRDLRFLGGGHAGIDFKRERDRPTGATLAVSKVAMVHPYWDLAILAVDGLGEAHKPLQLSLSDARDMTGREIFVIGYPAFDPRNPTAVQQDLFDGSFGTKRLQPGQLQGGMKTSSFGKLVLAATHDCSTLGGNSESAVIDLETGERPGASFRRPLSAAELRRTCFRIGARFPSDRRRRQIRRSASWRPQ